MTYFMNNGTEKVTSLFDDIFEATPDCGPLYYLQQSIDYTYKTDEDRTEKLFKDLIELDFQTRLNDNTAASQFTIKASSSDQLGYFDIKMKNEFKSVRNETRTWPELEIVFYFHLNASEIIFVQNSAPYFETSEEPMETEWNATDTEVPTEVALPTIIELNNETEIVTVKVTSDSVDSIN
mmetsp:Transcript_19666/g.30383  ORF Transcript_19666/g.30383 Transcript_19666/m.30383 type:complete len:180 (+) Transcript_19666:3765-4304(+)